MKLKFKVALPKEKKYDLLLLKEVLSKGGFVKLASGIRFCTITNYGMSLISLMLCKVSDSMKSNSLAKVFFLLLYKRLKNKYNHF